VVRRWERRAALLEIFGVSAQGFLDPLGDLLADGSDRDDAGQVGDIDLREPTALASPLRKRAVVVGPASLPSAL
jgi:hypothetical protein